MKTKILILIGALILIAIPMLNADSSDCVTNPDNYDEFCMQDSCSDETICNVPFCCCDDSLQNFSTKTSQECSDIGGMFISGYSQAYSDSYGGDLRQCAEFCGELNCTAAGLTCSEDCPATSDELCEKYSWLSNSCPSGDECWKIKDTQDVYEQCAGNEECEQGYDSVIDGADWCLKGHCVPKGIQLCEEQGNKCCSSGQIGIGNYYSDFYCSVGSCYDSCQTPTMCSSSDPDEISNINIQSVKDKPWLNLTWDNPCLNETIVTIITRFPDFPNKVIELTNHTSYLDKETAWDAWYTYNIYYITKYNAFSGITTINAQTGNSLCEHKSYDEFCLNNERKKCDENNRLIDAPTDLDPPNLKIGDDRTDCSDSYFKDNTQYNYTCTGPNSTGKTICKPIKNCETDETGSPFGMYFDVSSCCQDAFCYFDYSDTITDMCYNCDRDMSCFNYSSELACSMDNCGVDKSAGCSWLDTIPELGKGFCYEANYSDEDYCSLCGDNDDPFLNINCTQDVCSRLGNCYSNSNNCDVCSNISISPNKGCSEYKTEESCQGTQPASLDSNYYITSGADSCSLGVCRWIHVQNKCVKDGDLDYVADCSDSDVCKRDVSRPITAYSAPEYMGAAGQLINFTLDYAAGFYACIGNSSDFYCNPNSTDFSTSIDNYKKTEIDPVSSFGINKTGVYFFRFYSVDSNRNREQTREFFVFVDPTPPQINLDYDVINDTSSSDKSIFKFNIDSNEYADCNINLTKYNPETNKNEEKGSWNTGLVLSYSSSIPSLEDNIYTLNYACKDNFNNEVSDSILINVDRVHQIVNTKPDSTIKGLQTTLSFDTKDASICNLSGQGFAYDEARYSTSHSVIYPINEEGTHQISVSCISQYINQRDTTTIQFTVDNLAPNTTPIDRTTNQELNISGWVKGDFNLKLECNDQTYTAPGAFGCGKTEYCFGDMISCSSQDALWQTATDSVKINQSFCYRSVDKGGNAENIRCKTLMIDQNDPIIKISVENESIANINYLAAIINVSDLGSGLSNASYNIRDANGTILVNDSEIAISTGVKQKTQSINESPLNLVDGHAYIWTVKALDLSGRSSVQSSNDVIYIKDTDGDGQSDSTDACPNDPCCIKEPGDNYGGQNCEFINYNLTEPSFGVADNSSFDLAVQTDKTATCKLALSNLVWEMMADFKISGQKIHEIVMDANTWNIINGYYDRYTLFVKCDDNQIPVVDQKTGMFDLAYDTTSPIFKTTKFIPSTVPDIKYAEGATTPNSVLYIKTDDPTICKFAYNDTDYDSMNFEFDGFKNNLFERTHTKTVSLNPATNLYDYYVGCMNPAELINISSKISVYVNLNTTLVLTDLTPKYFNSTDVYLNLTTNKNSVCTYDGKQINSSDGYIHTQTVKLNSEGRYDYEVWCIHKLPDDVAYEKIGFTADTSPPEILELNDDSNIADNKEESASLNKLKVHWIVKDGLSGIDHVEYEIFVSNTGQKIANGNKSDEAFDGWITGLNLVEGNSYYFKIRAEDNVGWQSEWNITDGVYINKAAEPEHCSDAKRNYDEEGIDCGGSCTASCISGQSCLADLSCQGDLICVNETCIAPSCTDNRQNQNETGIDCGGPCPLCSINQGCENDSDCTEGLSCIDEVCIGIDLCNNDVQDAGETDLDCGGNNCDKCKLNQTCGIDADCESDYCRNETCAPKEEKDSDGDGMPDYWEVEHGLDPFDPDDAYEDLDGDGVSNLEEYLAETDPSDPADHPDVQDDDNDGLPNWWETKYCTGDCDPNEDPDGDGLTNLQEYQHGTDPTKADTDGDTYSDKDEINEGTNPLDSTDYPGKQKPKAVKEGLSALGAFFLLLASVLALAGIYFLGATYHYENYAFISMGVLVAAAAIINYVYIESIWLATISSIALIGGVSYFIYLQLTEIPLPEIRVRPRGEKPPAVRPQIEHEIFHESAALKKALEKKKQELIKKREEIFGKFGAEQTKKPSKIQTKIKPTIKQKTKTLIEKQIKKPAIKEKNVFEKIKNLSKTKGTKQDIFEQLSNILPGIKGDVFKKLPKRKKDAIQDLKKLNKINLTKKEIIEKLRKIAKK